MPDDLLQYQYNIKGEVTSASNNISAISYQRDSKGRILYSKAVGVGRLDDYPALELSQEFDNTGRRLSVDSSLGQVTYSYDAAYRMTALSHSNGNSFAFSYDVINRLTAIERPGSRTDFSYFSDSGALGQILHSANGATIGSWGYQYDARNFPIKKTGLSGELNYSYDNNGQLRSVAGVQSESFDYDAIGNRILDQNGSFIYDQNSQRLTEDYQYLYSYDRNGNLFKKIAKDPAKSSYSYSYNSKNQLIRLQITSTALGPVVKDISYSYDVLGRRMEKKIINLIDTSRSYSRRFVYDGDNVIGEYNQSSELLASYIHSPLQADDVLEVTYAPAAVAAGMTETYGDFYFLKDHLGSVTEIADSGGHIVQRYDYSAFGKIMDIKDGLGVDITASPKIRNSFTFTGREWDEESGLYYYRARMYDAGIGRFLQVDPDSGKLTNPTSFENPYLYVTNRPTALIDPTGKWIFAVGTIVSAIVGGTISDRQGNGFLSGAILGAAAFATGYYAGGLFANYMGLTGAGGAIAGAGAGGVAGGTVGAIGYQSLGIGTAADGFKFGFGFGVAGGGIGGYSESGLTSKGYNNLLTKNIGNGVDHANAYLSKEMIGSGYSFNLSGMMPYIAAADPYIVGTLAPIYLGNLLYRCLSDNCDVQAPTVGGSF